MCNICRLPKSQTCAAHTHSHPKKLCFRPPPPHPSSILWICVNFCWDPSNSWLGARDGTRVIPITCQRRKEKFSNCKTFIKIYIQAPPKIRSAPTGRFGPHNWPKGCPPTLRPADSDNIFNNKCISLSNLPHSAQHTCLK